MKKGRKILAIEKIKKSSVTTKTHKIIQIKTHPESLFPFYKELFRKFLKYLKKKKTEI